MRKTTIMLMATVMLVSFALVVSAATFQKPTASETLTGAVNFNVSVAYGELENCSVTATSASTSQTVNLLLLNSTEGPFANSTNTTTVFVDAVDWSFAGTCYNTTGDADTITTVSSVIVDNSVPTCTFGTGLTSGESYKPSQQWLVTGTNATAASLQFGSNSVLTMSETGSNSDVFSFTGTKSSVPEGVYAVTATTSDGTNSTACTLTSVEIDSDSILRSVGIALAQQPGKKQTSEDAKTGLGALPMGFWIIAGLGAAYMFMKKGKK